MLMEDNVIVEEALFEILEEGPQTGKLAPNQLIL